MKVYTNLVNYTKNPQLSYINGQFFLYAYMYTLPLVFVVVLFQGWSVEYHLSGNGCLQS